MGLDGKRVLLVGGSSGLGRVIGKELVAQGARVAFTARRKDRVEAAANEAGHGAVAIAGDVTDGDACAGLVEQAVAAFGGLDALVYTAAFGPLTRLIDADADQWRAVLDTNVIGASQVTRAAVPHLSESGGKAVYLSSVSGTHTPPWPGLGLYMVSKAALERLIETWRCEHPEVGFTTIVVGPSGAGEPDAPSEFASGWDPELTGELMPGWMARGLMTGNLIELSDLVTQVTNVLTTRASVSTVVIEPPGASTR